MPLICSFEDIFLCLLQLEPFILRNDNLSHSSHIEIINSGTLTRCLDSTSTIQVTFLHEKNQWGGIHIPLISDKCPIFSPSPKSFTLLKVLTKIPLIAEISFILSTFVQIYPSFPWNKRLCFLSLPKTPEMTSCKLEDVTTKLLCVWFRCKMKWTEWSLY